MSEPVIPERWKEQWSFALGPEGKNKFDWETLFTLTVEELGAAEAKVAKLEATVTELEKENGGNDALIFAAQDEIREQAARIEELRKVLANSEDYRRAYQSGKMALYSMGAPFTEAAMQHLPCGEGELDRRFTKLIEMPRIAERDKTIAEQAATIERLTETLREIKESYLRGEEHDLDDIIFIVDAALSK